jgi:hypothetical protein
MKRQAENINVFSEQRDLNNISHLLQRKEILLKEDMAILIGGDLTISHDTNTVLIGVGIGAVIGYIIGGPLGAIEGAFWGALLWSLWP